MGFYIAVIFLTRIPLPQKIFNENQLATSIPFFPLVGVVIGGILALIHIIIKDFLSAQAISVLLVLIHTMITGGMHLDGFADTMDGLFCGGDREKKLAVMRDSCTGAYGVMGITMVFLLKYAFLVSMSQDFTIKALLSFPVLSRWIMAFSMIFFPYGREKGLGKAFSGFQRPVVFYFVTILILSAMYFLAGIAGITIALATLALGTIFIKHIISELGGMTGDTYGALNEFCEIIVLLLFAIISNKG